MESLFGELEKLNKKKLILFSLLCSEFLLENYRFFVSTFKWGDSNVLENSIYILGTYLIDNESKAKLELESLMDKVDGIIPDSEKFPSILTSFAMDAGNCVYETLNFIKSGNIQSVFDVSTFCTDTVDLYIQERDDMDYDDPEFEEKISTNELMVAEISRQHSLVDSLSKTDSINRESIEKLRSINRDTMKPDLTVF